MAPNFDIAPLFDKDEWADVVLKFGDKEVKCHRVILGSKSEYFKTLLKRDSGFKVDNKTRGLDHILR